MHFICCTRLQKSLSVSNAPYLCDSSLELGVIRPNNQCRQYSEAWCKYLFFPQVIVSDFFLKGSVFSVPLRTEIEPRCVCTHWHKAAVSNPETVSKINMIPAKRHFLKTVVEPDNRRKWNFIICFMQQTRQMHGIYSITITASLFYFRRIWHILALNFELLNLLKNQSSVGCCRFILRLSL